MLLRSERRVLKGFLYLLIIFLLVGCANNDSSEETEVSIVTSSTEDIEIAEDKVAPNFIKNPIVDELTEYSANISWKVEDDYGPPNISITLNDIVLYSGKDNQFQITELEPATQYSIIIVASDANENITTRLINFETLEIVDNEPPRFIKSLTLDDVTSSSATISWEVDDILSNFSLSLTINDEIVDNFISPFTFDDLKPASKYSIKIEAIDEKNNSSSNSLTFQTLQDPNIQQTGINFKKPLSISDISSNSAIASWEVENQSGDTKFTLLLGDFVVYEGKDSSYQLSNLEPTTYYELDLIDSGDRILTFNLVLPNHSFVSRRLSNINKP